MDNVGQKLRLLRLGKGLKLTEVAKRAELSQASLSFIETGQNSPTIDTLSRILAVLDISLSDFFAPEYDELPLEIRNLISSAKQLTPGQIEILNQFIKSITEEASTKDDLSLVDEPHSKYDLIAASGNPNPMDDLPQESIDQIEELKRKRLEKYKKN